ncbi:hypothetical protein BKA70DRAFT_50126 [Coprinopsis sp. MPI-PUGE-AT-0042]|nr:hypothetical protein BKA70DRAFT_50126 [Coprinopsis sp. MPI-PUGE-AT-0042]
MQYGHAFGNEDVSGTGKLEAGGYQPPQQYPQYQGHREHEEIPHLTPPFPYPASSGTLPPAVLTTDHAHITRGDANPRYHKIKDFFKGRRHRHKDEHREHEPLPQIPDLSVALSDTQSLGRYPHMHVGAEPDLAPTMAGEVGTMRSHPHRRSINHSKYVQPLCFGP